MLPVHVNVLLRCQWEVAVKGAAKLRVAEPLLNVLEGMGREWVAGTTGLWQAAQLK